MALAVMVARSRGTQGAGKKGKVTVDDCSLFLARTNKGAVASFEAARQAANRGLELRPDERRLRLAHAVGALHPDVPHGAALVAISRAWFRIMAEADPDRMGDLAMALDQDKSMDSAMHYARLSR